MHRPLHSRGKIHYAQCIGGWIASFRYNVINECRKIKFPLFRTVTYFIIWASKNYSDDVKWNKLGNKEKILWGFFVIFCRFSIRECRIYPWWESVKWFLTFEMTKHKYKLYLSVSRIIKFVAKVFRCYNFRTRSVLSSQEILTHRAKSLIDTSSIWKQQ
jgi:hypothetical protein